MPIMKTKPVEVLVPVRVERLPASKFVEVVDHARANIARSRFVPPTVGSRNFGHFEVEYKVPVLKRAA